MEVVHCGNYSRDLDLDPMTFMNLIRIQSRYTGCAKMNFVRRGFRKLSYDRQTDRQTDATEIIYHAASRMVNNTAFRLV